MLKQLQSYFVGGKLIVLLSPAIARGFFGAQSCAADVQNWFFGTCPLDSVAVVAFEAQELFMASLP